MTQKEALERLDLNISTLCTDFLPIGGRIGRRISNEGFYDKFGLSMQMVKIVEFITNGIAAKYEIKERSKND